MMGAKRNGVLPAGRNSALIASTAASSKIVNTDQYKSVIKMLSELAVSKKSPTRRLADPLPSDEGREGPILST